jgi:hypothetical protein
MELLDEHSAPLGKKPEFVDADMLTACALSDSSPVATIDKITASANRN